MRIMGIDYGTKRIGIAISDPSGTMAHPLDTVAVKANGSHIEDIRALAAEYEITLLVVGLPYNMDGSIGPNGEKVIAWSKELESSLCLPVVLWDERLTTSEAHDFLIHLKVKGKQRKNIVDKIAASIILNDYLNSTQP